MVDAPGESEPARYAQCLPLAPVEASAGYLDKLGLVCFNCNRVDLWLFCQNIVQ